MIAPPPAPSNHSDGDSDSDWDDDDDFASKKINIKIKPIAQMTPSKISASVDELRATVGTWKSLANVNLVKPNSRRHHQSNVQLNNIDSQSNKLAPSATSSVILPDGMILMDSKTNNQPALNGGPLVPPHRTSMNSNGHPSMSIPSNTRNQVLDLDQLSIGLDQLEEKDDFYLQYRNVKPMETRNKFRAPPIPPNGFLQPMPSSVAILNPTFQTAPPTEANSNNNNSRCFPVAFAIQECINARLVNNNGSNSASLIGRLKMAVPLEINATTDEFTKTVEMKHNLMVTFITSMPWEKIRLNKEFVRELEDEQSMNQPFAPSSFTIKKLSINMKSIQDYTKKLNQKNNTRYYILPELLKYTIGSQEKKLELLSVVDTSDIALKINPLNAMAHWLYDLNTTKVRVDISSISTTLNELQLTTEDIRNLKITMNINGGVVSYQSKPEAHWNPLSSTLTWFFSSLTELAQKSTLNGVTSCMARFDLSDGPSTPNEVGIQFAIIGKTISGSHVTLDDSINFRLAAHKFEVRTGVFKCDPLCL